MKFLGLLDADLDRTPLGTRARLADDFAGTPVLRRTVERIAACADLADIVVCCPAEQQPRVAQLLAGTRARVVGRNAPPPPFRHLVRAARKWSLDGWRGGLGGSTALDEYVDPVLCALLGRETKADAVAVFPPGAALIDPALVAAMLAHAATHVEDSKLTFAQAPPGLVPTVFQTGLCVQLAEKHVPAGWTLAYKPDDPSIDLVFRPCNFPVPQAVRYASGRLTADTARSWRLMQRIHAADPTDAEALCTLLLAESERCVDPRPREVEVELTTEDPLPETPLR
ncbi:MAG TPA: hypothetical protein P5572_07185, partial [Phycisphaerae bacterium]|nr:hypothetical protein [Phycisphaerae bacterium]